MEFAREARPNGAVWIGQRVLDAVLTDGVTAGRTNGWRSGSYAPALGRYVAETVFWTPAAVLPGRGVVWEFVDTDCARLTVAHQGVCQSVDVTVAPDGPPTQVSFERWSNANPEKQFRLQPFGTHLSVFSEVRRAPLAHPHEAGSHFDTDQCFPFLVVEVTNVDFPHD